MSILSNMKPLRVDDQHDVVNFYSLQANTGAKGTLLQVVGSGIDILRMTPQIKQNLAALLNTSTNAYSPLYEIRSKVQPCPSGQLPFGIQLLDVKDKDAWGYPYRYELVRKDENEYLVSGEAVPIARRGTFLLRVGTGTNAAVSGGANPTYLATSDDGQGSYKLQSTNVNACGEFLSTPDAQGYAIVYINCYKI